MYEKRKRNEATYLLSASFYNFSRSRTILSESVQKIEISSTVYSSCVVIGTIFFVVSEIRHSYIREL